MCRQYNPGEKLVLSIDSREGEGRKGRAIYWGGDGLPISGKFRKTRLWNSTKREGRIHSKKTYTDETKMERSSPKS